MINIFDTQFAIKYNFSISTLISLMQKFDEKTLNIKQSEWIQCMFRIQKLNHKLCGADGM